VALVAFRHRRKKGCKKECDWITNNILPESLLTEREREGIFRGARRTDATLISRSRKRTVAGHFP
jgi:hypothetical protein